MGLRKDLEKMDACEEALEWVGKRRSLQKAWDECEKPDWLIWLAGKTGTPTEKLVEAAIYCALEVYKDEDFRKWAEAWLSGEDRSEEAARAAAWAARAARAAEAAAEAAAWAAWAAWSAEAAAAWAAEAAAWAAEAAAWAAEAAEAAWAADPKKLCNIVRSILECPKDLKQ